MDNFYTNPRELTPNQVIYLEDYCKKSKDFPEEFKSVPEEHYVYEWEDGSFLDFTIQDNSGFDYKGDYIEDKCFYIWCLFSKKNSVKKYKKIEKLAKEKYKCNNIRFSTFRKKDAWIKLIEKVGGKLEEEQIVFKLSLKG
tara:strand:+ start:279 stop:698 length:420 start_codon:yes stop_codon:yes gene_type:complete